MLGIDTTTPGGKALFQVMRVFERAMIQERIHAGLDRARAQGKRLGRPPLSDTVKHAIRKHRERSVGIKGIAAELGVGVGTVQRTLADLA